MISVILRDGRVLKYNNADRWRQDGNFIQLESEKYMYAVFPKECIERVEYAKPCKILKESRDKKRMKKY